MAITNKQVLLKNYVEGCPKESDFDFKFDPADHREDLSHECSEGALVLKNLYLACDPYMRHRMCNHGIKDAPILSTFFPRGSVLKGYGVAKVIKSRHPDFKGDEYVWGVTGWENYTLVIDPQGLNKISFLDMPLSYYAGILGMPGLAAYYGLFNVCSPKKGETIYVSSAAGGVGQLVGQFAKNAGCYVVGSTSTSKKVDVLKEKLGFDGAFNYKEETDLSAVLHRYFPDGIDIYFDNVGGKMLDEVLLHMKVQGRIAVCGMISQYNLDKPDGVHNLFNIVLKRIRMEGFIETDIRSFYPGYLEMAKEHLKAGKLVYIEDIVQGLEMAPRAFVGMFQGNNIGKQIVCIAEE